MMVTMRIGLAFRGDELRRFFSAADFAEFVLGDAAVRHRFIAYHHAVAQDEFSHVVHDLLVRPDGLPTVFDRGQHHVVDALLRDQIRELKRSTGDKVGDGEPQKVSYMRQRKRRSTRLKQ